MLTFPRLLVATLAWGVLAFGAAYPWAYWPLALMVSALGVWAIVSTRAWEDRRTRLLAGALGCVAVAIAVQLVPLPLWLRSDLSPGVDKFLSSFRVGFISGDPHPLSIRPARTAVALALFVAFACFLVGLTRAIRRVSLDWLVNQLLGLGVGLAVLGVVQKALSDPATPSPTVYGFWTPLGGGNPFGPFINRNHFAGWMVMVLPVVIGYACAVMKQSVWPRSASATAWLRWLPTVQAHRPLLLAVAMLTMGMALVLTGSRSGIASLAAALLVIGYFLVKHVQGQRARGAAVVCLGVLLVGALLWAGVERTITRFQTAPSGMSARMSAWEDSIAIARDFPVFGSGLGTYGRAMLLYQTRASDPLYIQAHNDYLQLIVEGGILVGIPVAFVFALIGRGIATRFRRGEDDTVTYWVRVGAVAGLAGIAVQSLVEFSLQMPGNAATFILLLAVALHRPSRRTSHAHRV